ncbi:alpha/beta fold hydrolase [bacterium]|jgi:alpha-beta hydrolase superfamily lysophospholipase|nr:alpha/beta fold hydrolase [bacterium]
MSQKNVCLPFLLSLITLASTLTLAPPAAAAPRVTTTTKTTTTRTTSKKVPVWAAKLRVPYRSWLPLNQPKEVLLCVHGLGFSSASFADFGRSMAGRGFAVYAVDVRGFGQWAKRKGQDTVDFEACLLDIEQALKSLRKAYPGVPVFMVGESMGGAIAMAATARHPELVDGLVSSVPSSDRYYKIGGEIIVGAHYLEDPDKKIDPEIVDKISTDERTRAQMTSNSMNRLTLTPKELKQFETFMKGNFDNAHLIEKPPVLMLAGFKDKLVKPEGTIELFNALSTQDKLLMVIGDGEHLLLEENQLTNQLAQMLNVWITDEGRAFRSKGH